MSDSRTIANATKDLLRRVFQKATKTERESMYQEMWEACWEERKAMERQWQINMSFYAGNQYIGWNTRVMGVQELKAPSHRILIVDNRIMPKVRAAISRQMGKTGAQVVPASTSELDMKRAELKERILLHHDDRNHMATKQFSLALWGKVCGTAYTDVDWRDAGGAMYRDGMETFVEGEIRTKIRSPWEVWMAPDARMETFGSWCWVGELMDVDVAEDEYNLKDLRSDSDEYYNPFLHSRMYGFFEQSANLASMGDERPRHQNQLMVRRLWIFPTNKNPKGREVLFMNGEAKAESDFSWFPLTKYINMPYFDRATGDTELRQCIPLQKQRNRTRSSVAEYLRTMVKGKYIAHKSNKLGTSALNTEHLEVVQWDGSGPPPHQMNLQSLPSDVWQELAINDQSMDDIFADRPSSQGRREEGVGSGRMVHLLQEEDDRQHTPTVALWEQCWERTNEKVLDLASKKYTDGKMIAVVGEDQKYHVNIIKRNLLESGEPAPDDLLGGPNRVRIELGASLPKNKTLRSQLIMERYGAGLYGDPQDPIVRRKVLKQLEDGIVDDVYDDTKLDETRALEENIQMMMNENGEVPAGAIDDDLMRTALVAPSPWENHNVHLMIHNRARKGVDYRKLPEQLALIFDAHCQMHEELIMMQAMEMMQQQTAMMPPEPGAEQQGEAIPPPPEPPPV